MGIILEEGEYAQGLKKGDRVMINECRKYLDACSAWGGHPPNYVNSRFIVGKNPWGNEDLRYFPREQFRKDVAAIRKDYDFYQSIKDLQYEFIEDYEILPSRALKTTYSNGAIMLSNPTDMELEIDGKKIASFSNLII